MKVTLTCVLLAVFVGTICASNKKVLEHLLARPNVIEAVPEEDITQEMEMTYRRQGRNAIGRECVSRDQVSSGVCMQRNLCAEEEGTVSGACRKGVVCCIGKENHCTSSTSRNNTHFVNRDYPSPDSGTGACTLTINRMNDNICQMRFDFRALELSQPDSNGFCVTDFLSVTGGTFDSPIVCGSNTGQHMYVDVDPQGGAVRLRVDRTAASMSDRTWDIEVSQIECTSKYKAPAGCLQYFIETSGTVSSFNFNQEIDVQKIPQTTRQMREMRYGVCIKMADGYCSIRWSRNITGGDYGFTVSSNIAGVERELIGDPASSSSSYQCTTDYVVIPGGKDNNGNLNSRYCGAGFPNHVTSNLRPFIMYVVSDEDEEMDVLNRGFNLDYRQIIC